MGGQVESRRGEGSEAADAGAAVGRRGWEAGKERSGSRFARAQVAVISLPRERESRAYGPPGRAGRPCVGHAAAHEKRMVSRAAADGRGEDLCAGRRKRSGPSQITTTLLGTYRSVNRLERQLFLEGNSHSYCSTFDNSQLQVGCKWAFVQSSRATMVEVRTASVRGRASPCRGEDGGEGEGEYVT